MHGSKPPLTRILKTTFTKRFAIIFKQELYTDHMEIIRSKKGEVIPQHFRFNFDYLKNEKRFEIIRVR